MFPRFTIFLKRNQSQGVTSDISRVDDFELAQQAIINASEKPISVSAYLKYRAPTQSHTIINVPF